jgi:hypothetical protein
MGSLQDLVDAYEARINAAEASGPRAEAARWRQALAGELLLRDPPHARTLARRIALLLQEQAALGAGTTLAATSLEITIGQATAALRQVRGRVEVAELTIAEVSKAPPTDRSRHRITQSRARSTSGHDQIFEDDRGILPKGDATARAPVKPK